MVHPEFAPKTFDDKITHLIEECGEVVVAAAKVKRFGLHNGLPGREPFRTNKDDLLYEMMDLREAILKVVQAIQEEDMKHYANQ